MTIDALFLGKSQEFFQVENHERDPRKGFGLGLAIARRLARQLGGDITVESAVGTGSQFTIVLPGVLAGDIAEEPAVHGMVVDAATAPDGQRRGNAGAQQLISPAQ